MEQPPLSSDRRHFTGAQKLAILREHLIEKVPISDVRQKHGIQPTLFYLWQKKLFEDGAVVFESKAANARQSRRAGTETRKVQTLEAKLPQKKEILAELMGEHVALKKVLARPERPMDRPRCAGRGDRLRQPLGRQGRTAGQPLHRLAGHFFQQVLRLKEPLRQSQRAQRMGTPQPLAGRLGEGRHPRLRAAVPAGGLPPLHRPLGDPRVDDRGPGRAAHPAGTREVPGRPSRNRAVRAS